MAEIMTDKGLVCGLIIERETVKAETPSETVKQEVKPETAVAKPAAKNTPKRK